MIYLISVEYRYETLLKIGYTADKNSKKRFDTYKMHNPKSVVLFTIPGGTEKHEKAIHHKFRPFLYSGYGNEWFNFDQTIIDFFTIHTTKESLDNDLKTKSTVNTRDLPRLHKEINRLVNRWLCIDSDTPEKLQQNYTRIKRIILDCRKAIRKDILDEGDILPYLIRMYNISDEQLVLIQNDIIPDNISKFLSDFYGFKDFPDKMKLVCTVKLEDKDMRVALNYLPLTYKLYYEILGPDRCRACGYIKTDIEKEFRDLKFNKQDLSDRIYDIFKINEKYTKSEIKDTLKNLYTELGYNKTPKANDLEKYFKIRDCRITNKETGKRDHGFEIIKRKDIY